MKKAFAVLMCMVMLVLTGCRPGGESEAPKVPVGGESGVPEVSESGEQEPLRVFVDIEYSSCILSPALREYLN